MSDYGAPTPLTREEESTVVQPLYPEEVTYVQEGFRHRYDELKKELEPLAVAAERSVVLYHPAPHVHVLYERQYVRLDYRSETARCPRLVHSTIHIAGFSKRMSLRTQ